MKSLIFGYGITGQSFERYLLNKEISFDIYDKDITYPNILWELPNREKLKSYEMIYLSPGINIRKLYPNGEFDEIPFLTDLDIFFQEDNSYKIGITGTNGKSTCCHHLNQILSYSQLVGNIGRPVLDHMNMNEYSIIEISSFQLEKVKEINLDFGVLLNISPDHIDHHGSFKEYLRVKNRIKESKVSTRESDPKKLWSMITKRHHNENKDFRFSNLNHRFETIPLEFHHHNGETYKIINDSKATNLAALEFALNKMQGPYYLILCGDPNKEQYKNYKIIGPKMVFIVGQHAREIYKRTSHPKKILLHNEGLRSALLSIRDNTDLHLGTPILFSPGHPSGKDYKNFEERGDHFKELVQALYD